MDNQDSMVESEASGAVCAQCEANAHSNEAGGYTELAAECRAYCLRGHRGGAVEGAKSIYGNGKEFMLNSRFGDCACEHYWHNPQDHDQKCSISKQSPHPLPEACGAVEGAPERIWIDGKIRPPTMRTIYAKPPPEGAIDSVEYMRVDRPPTDRDFSVGAFDDCTKETELSEALANQRRELGAQHDATLDELKRVRAVAKEEIDRLNLSVEHLARSASELLQRAEAAEQAHSVVPQPDGESLRGVIYQTIRNWIEDGHKYLNGRIQQGDLGDLSAHIARAVAHSCMTLSGARSHSLRPDGVKKRGRTNG